MSTSTPTPTLTPTSTSTRTPVSSTLQPAHSVTGSARYYEYSTAANPIGAKIIPRVPYHSFLPELYTSGPTRVVPLDLSEQLKTQGPATGPGLVANFVRVLAGEKLSLAPVATSLVMYAIEGQGRIEQGDTRFDFSTGGFVTLPGGVPATVSAETLTTMYYVNDEPLLNYLGVKVAAPRFEPTYYPSEAAQEELRKARSDPNAGKRSRISILLGNEHFPLTRTATHTMWAMYGILPGDSEQKPHRHQSIALDFIVKAPKGCYSMVGTELDDKGEIVKPQRVDWVSGMAFVTPPGYWHAHFNESGEDALLIPIQDAGLQTYLRSLDIRFAA